MLATVDTIAILSLAFVGILVAAAMLNQAYEGKKGQIEVSEPWFGHLRSGEKTVEGKKGNKKWRDEIASGFVLIKKKGDPSASFLTRVVGVREYKTVREMLESEGLRNVLPGIADIERGVNVYMVDCGWTPKEVEDDGVIAIELERA